MDWLLYDNALRHERVNVNINSWNIKVVVIQNPVNWFAEANQLTGFYMMATLAFNELKWNVSFILLPDALSHSELLFLLYRNHSENVGFKGELNSKQQVLFKIIFFIMKQDGIIQNFQKFTGKPQLAHLQWWRHLRRDTAKINQNLATSWKTS